MARRLGDVNSGEKSWGLNQDQLPTTHPIVAPINDLNDTYVNFDGITYAKGASVLKQLVAYVGRDRFFEGINHYLNNHSYSNATLADLLAELAETSGRDLKAWSAKWLEQAGVNTIAATVEENADGTIASLTLTPDRARRPSGAASAPSGHRLLRRGRRRPHRAHRPHRTGRRRRDHRRRAGRRQAAPGVHLVNDDDLTYAKLRFDAKSLEFAAENHVPLRRRAGPALWSGCRCGT